MNHRIPPAPLFVSDQQYLDDVKDSNSVGGKVQWNYNFFPAWTFVVKYDYLMLDINYTKDYYQRYGFGFRHFFNNQVSAQIRYEHALVTPKREQAAQVKGLAAQNAIWALLQVKI